jgi:hypothetical protein
VDHPVVGRVDGPAARVYRHYAQDADRCAKALASWTAFASDRFAGSPPS